MPRSLKECLASEILRMKGQTIDDILLLSKMSDDVEFDAQRQASWLKLTGIKKHWGGIISPRSKKNRKKQLSRKAAKEAKKEAKKEAEKEGIEFVAPNFQKVVHNGETSTINAINDGAGHESSNTNVRRVSFDDTNVVGMNEESLENEQAEDTLNDLDEETLSNFACKEKKGAGDFVHKEENGDNSFARKEKMETIASLAKKKMEPMISPLLVKQKKMEPVILLAKKKMEPMASLAKKKMEPMTLLPLVKKKMEPMTLPVKKKVGPIAKKQVGSMMSILI